MGNPYVYNTWWFSSKNRMMFQKAMLNSILNSCKFHIQIYINSILNPMCHNNPIYNPILNPHQFQIATETWNVMKLMFFFKKNGYLNVILNNSHLNHDYLMEIPLTYHGYLMKNPHGNHQHQHAPRRPMAVANQRISAFPWPLCFDPPATT